MNKKIVCAIDFSPAADEASDLALHLARLFGDRLELVHWIRGFSFLHPDMVAGALEPLRQQAMAAIGPRRSRLSGKGVDVEAQVEVGDAVDGVVERGASSETRLLVVGSAHGRAEGTRGLIGSLARAVGRRAACPVLAVPATSILSRGGWTPDHPLKVTVAVDLSPATDAALDWVRSLTEITACQVELVHAYWPLREGQRLGLPWSPEEFDADLEIREILDREVRARVERIWGRSTAPLHLRPGTGVSPALIATEAQAEGADLLVVGTSQHRIGSMGLGTMLTAKLPVLCVPARMGATPAEATTIAPLRTLMVPTDLSTLGNAAVAHCRWDHLPVPRGDRHARADASRARRAPPTAPRAAALRSGEQGRPGSRLHPREPAAQRSHRSGRPSLGL